MKEQFLRALDTCAAAGTPAQFWLRDDDAVEPTAALDQLLARVPVPLTLAVIPAFVGAALVQRLAGEHHVTVAPHGWAHLNHAGEGQKKQELGDHRPVPVVLADIAMGAAKVQTLFGAQYTPVLVPPWNRIAPHVVAGLPGIGIKALSVYGPEKPGPLPQINTHVDVMDWHGTRGGRPDDALLAELAQSMQTGTPVGLLTHHLVHDAQVWGFLDRLLALTVGHPGCRWVGLADLLA